MTFPRIRPPGLWVLGSAFSPSEMEQIDDHQSKAVDGYAGGSYAPGSATGQMLTIGGLGMHVTAQLTADDLRAIVTNTHEIEFQSGSKARFESGSKTEYESGATAEWKSGSDLLTQSGSTSTFNGVVDVYNDVTVKSTGSITIDGGGGLLTVDGIEVVNGNITVNGVARINPDGLLLVNGSSGHNAETTFGQYSETSFDSGSATEFKSGSTIQISSGVTFNQNAMNNRTGADIPTGTSAYSALRVAVTGPAGTATITPANQDILIVPGALSSSPIWTINDPPHPMQLIIHTYDGSAQGQILTVKDSSGRTLGAMNNGAGEGSLVITFDGTYWMLTSAVSNGVP